AAGAPPCDRRPPARRCRPTDSSYVSSGPRAAGTVTDPAPALPGGELLVAAHEAARPPAGAPRSAVRLGGAGVDGRGRLLGQAGAWCRNSNRRLARPDDERGRLAHGRAPARRFRGRRYVRLRRGRGCRRNWRGRRRLAGVPVRLGHCRLRRVVVGGCCGSLAGRLALGLAGRRPRAIELAGHARFRIERREFGRLTNVLAFAPPPAAAPAAPPPPLAPVTAPPRLPTLLARACRRAIGLVPIVQGLGHQVGGRFHAVPLLAAVLAAATAAAPAPAVPALAVALGVASRLVGGLLDRFVLLDLGLDLGRRAWRPRPAGPRRLPALHPPAPPP